MVTKDPMGGVKPGTGRDDGGLPSDPATVFRSGGSVDIVVGVKSETPTVMPSSIYECDHSKRLMIIAQTVPPMLRPPEERDTGVTCLYRGSSDSVVRIGVLFAFLNRINGYQLTGGTKVPAVEIRYHGRIHRMNERAAFRVQPGVRFRVEGTVRIGGDEFSSAEHFNVHDISIGGMALRVPRYLRRRLRNPMYRMAGGTTGRAELVLMGGKTAGAGLSLGLDIRVVRRIPWVDDQHGMFGVQFVGLSRADEDKLSRFVCDVQLFRIQSAKGG